MSPAPYCTVTIVRTAHTDRPYEPRCSVHGRFLAYSFATEIEAADAGWDHAADIQRLIDAGVLG